MADNSKKMNKVFFQIGTNNGNDLFRELCREKQPDTIVLIEANIAHLQEIKDNYKAFPNVNIFNNAIYYEDGLEVELYLPAMNGEIGRPGENGHTYCDGGFSLLPMNDWGDKNNMATVKAKTKTFDTICRELDITNIEYLQIDTEGFDSEIIKMINLDHINIKQIRYEKWGFEKDRFTRHNSPGPELGAEGMLRVEEKLKKHNYTLQDISDVDGNDILATKQ